MPEFYKNSLMYLILKTNSTIPYDVLANAQEEEYSELLSEYLGIENEFELKEYISDML